MSTTGALGGTGFGLALVTGNALRMGGVVRKVGLFFLATVAAAFFMGGGDTFFVEEALVIET